MNIFFFITIIKPNIIFGNIISMLGGFFLSSKGCIDFFLLNFSILGLICIIAASCILNNIIDRDIDCLMLRTKNRLLVVNHFLYKQAIVYAIALVFLGLCIFIFFVNCITAFLSIFALFIYVFLYSAYFKRNSIYSTIVGSFSGSIPPVIGYYINNQDINYCSVILFLIFFCWQISHFYCISVLYENDYKQIKLPIFLICKGINKTQINICIHIFLFFITVFLLYFNNMVGEKYIIFMSFFIFLWLIISLLGFIFVDCFIFKKINFYFSIFIIFIFSILISIDYR